MTDDSVVKAIIIMKKVWAEREKLEEYDYKVDAVATVVTIVMKWIVLEAVQGV